MAHGTFSTRLERIRDELALRAHLGAMDARTAWDGLHLERLADELSGLREEARLMAHLGAMEARDAWARLDGEVQVLAGKTGEAADHAVSAMITALAEILEQPSKTLEQPSKQEEAR